MKMMVLTWLLVSVALVTIFLTFRPRAEPVHDNVCIRTVGHPTRVDDRTVVVLECREWGVGTLAPKT